MPHGVGLAELGHPPLLASLARRLSLASRWKAMSFAKSLNMPTVSGRPTSLGIGGGAAIRLMPGVRRQRACRCMYDSAYRTNSASGERTSSATNVLISSSVALKGRGSSQELSTSLKAMNAFASLSMWTSGSG